MLSNIALIKAPRIKHRQIYADSLGKLEQGRPEPSPHFKYLLPPIWAVVFIKQPVNPKKRILAPGFPEWREHMHNLLNKENLAKLVAACM